MRGKRAIKKASVTVPASGRENKAAKSASSREVTSLAKLRPNQKGGVRKPTGLRKSRRSKRQGVPRDVRGSRSEKGSSWSIRRRGALLRDAGFPPKSCEEYRS